MERYIAQRQRNPAFGAVRPTGDAAWYQAPTVGLKRVRDNAKMQRAEGYKGPDKCWDGYEAVPSKKRGEKGSCKKKTKTRKKRPSKTKKGKESTTDATSSDDEKKKKKKDSK